jgi:hypothetical protein
LTGKVPPDGSVRGWFPFDGAWDSRQILKAADQEKFRRVKIGFAPWDLVSSRLNGHSSDVIVDSDDPQLPWGGAITMSGWTYYLLLIVALLVFVGVFMYVRKKAG